MIRVGRCIYDRRGGRDDPYYPNFRTIVVLTKGTNRWGALGPYELKDERGRIMENVWQFSKTYPRVDATTQRKSRYENIIIWKHPSETHLADPTKAATPDNLTPEYWGWRQKGLGAPYAIRYPPGYGKMANCVGLLAETGAGIALEGPLDYIESRKKLYVPLYTRLVRQCPLFAELRRMLERGQNILIAEVDGPHQESLAHYMQTYGANADFIASHSVAASPKNLKILLEDPLHPFGHGYCLAAALAGINLLEDSVPSGAPAGDGPSLEDFTDEDLNAALTELTSEEDVHVLVGSCTSAHCG